VAELGPVRVLSGRGVRVGEGDGVGYFVVLFGVLFGGGRGGKEALGGDVHVVQRDGWLVVDVVWG
jgi:hypothetical protein